MDDHPRLYHRDAAQLSVVRPWLSGGVLMDEVVIDPYGGFQETWPQQLLDDSSQRSNLVFVDEAVRAMPRIDQISFPDVWHYEICGPDIIACCAYACGHTDDAVATLKDLLAYGRYLGYNFSTGSNVTQLATLCSHFGWRTLQDNSPAGDLGERLITSHQVACAALNTSYGAGSLWNVLHPEAGGKVGHFEGVGAVDGGYVMDATKEESVDQAYVWETYESVLGRIADTAGFAWALGVARKSHTDLLWSMINGPEYKANGGLLGRLANLQAQIDALKAGQTGAAVDKAGEDAQNAHVVALEQAVAAINDKFSGIAKALTPQPGGAGG